MTSAIGSTLLLAQYRKLNTIRSWRDLVGGFPRFVALHEQKLIVPQRYEPKTPRNAKKAKELSIVQYFTKLFFGRDDGARPTWCVEARQRSWQHVARTWNQIVGCLRQGDLLSDNEEKELLFDGLQGEPPIPSEFETQVGVASNPTCTPAHAHLMRAP